MGTPSVRIVCATIVATLLTLSGSVSAVASEESTVRARRSVDLLVPQAPVVVLPDSRVPMIAGFTNDKRKPKRVKVRFGTWCGTRTDGLHYQWTPKFRVTIPPTNTPNQPYNPSPERSVARTVHVDEGCYHDTQPGHAPYDGFFEVQLFAHYQSSQSTGFFIGRPFIRKNVRYNLGLQSGRRSPEKFQAHHTLPVKYESRFQRVGLNIHDPLYLRWWCSKPGVPTNHQHNAAEYNRRWGKWLRHHPHAGRKAILAFRTSLSRQYVYHC